MMDTAIWVYPFDVLDGEPERVLGEIAALGVRAVSVAATYHAGRLLLPHNPRRTVLFLEDGVAYFHADAARYRGLSLQAKVAEMARTEDPFLAIRTQAKAAGLAVNAWAVCLHNSRLGRAHAERTVHNAFGEPYTYALCPSDAEVRAYALALLDDLARCCAPDAIELEAIGFMGYEHHSHHDKVGLRLDAAHTFLLSLCFCASCAARLRARDLDPDALAADCRGALRTYFDRGGPPGASEPAAVEEILVRLLGAERLRTLCAVREAVVATLVAEVRARLPRSIAISCMAAPSPYATGAAAGLSLAALRPHVDAMILNLFTADERAMAGEVERARAAAGPGARLYANVRVHPPDSDTEASFLRKVAMLVAAGVDGLRFYHYGLVPRANLGWIRSAIRRWSA